MALPTNLTPLDVFIIGFFPYTDDDLTCLQSHEGKSMVRKHRTCAAVDLTISPEPAFHTSAWRILVQDTEH